MIEIIKAEPPFQTLELHYRKILYLFILFYNVWTFSVKLDGRLINLVPGGLQNPLIPILYANSQIRQYIYHIHTNILHNNLEDTVEYMILALLTETKKFSKILHETELANKEIKEEDIPKSLYDFYYKTMPNTARFANKSQHDFIREIKTKISFVKDIKYMPQGSISFDLKALVYTETNLDQFSKLVKRGIFTNENYKEVQDKYASTLTAQFATLAISSDFMDILKNKDFSALKQKLGSHASILPIPVFNLFPTLALDAFVCHLAPHILNKMCLSKSACTSDKMKDVQDIFVAINLSDKIEFYVKDVVLPLKQELLSKVNYNADYVFFHQDFEQNLNQIYGSITPFSVFLPKSCKIICSNANYLSKLENISNLTVNDKIKVKDFSKDLVNDVLKFYQQMLPVTLSTFPEYNYAPYKLHSAGIKLMEIILAKNTIPLQKAIDLDTYDLKPLFNLFAPSVFYITPLQKIRSVAIAFAIELDKIKTYGSDCYDQQKPIGFKFGGDLDVLDLMETTNTLDLFIGHKTLDTTTKEWYDGFKLMICTIHKRIKNEDFEPLTNQNFYAPLLSFFNSFISISNGVSFYTNPLSVLSQHIPSPILTKILSELQNKKPNFAVIMKEHLYPLDDTFIA